jgi:putative glutamine amidotransferase
MDSMRASQATAAAPIFGATPVQRTSEPSKREALPALAPIDRDRLPKPALPASFTKVEGLSATVWLPIAATRHMSDPLKEYSAKIVRSGAFPEDEATLRALGTRDRRVVTLEGDRPKVAILVGKPMRFAPDQSHMLNLISDRVRALGCEPVLIPPMADVLMPADRKEVKRQLSEHLRGFDAMIGIGGPDVHPRLYREPIRHANRWELNYPRDRFDADVLEAGLASELFLLGICRTHQLVNLILGGKLNQDMIVEGQSSLRRDQELDYGMKRSERFVVKDELGKVTFEHRVDLDRDSDAAQILGETSVVTNSLHHQAVAKPGEGLEVTGTLRDPKLGTDSIEVTEGKKVLTTQFHPEELTWDEHMAALVDTAARRAHVLALKKQGASEHEILESMKSAPEGRYIAADFTWVESRLFS